MKTTTTKVIAAVAVVGSLAAIAALLGNEKSSTAPSTRFLAADPLISTQDVETFNSFLAKYNRNYLTKDEFNARLGVFRSNLDLIRSHDAEKTGFSIGLN
jgi:hypothetical protein